jgi:hypothetical protein
MAERLQAVTARTNVFALLGIVTEFVLAKETVADRRGVSHQNQPLDHFKLFWCRNLLQNRPTPSEDGGPAIVRRGRAYISLRDRGAIIKAAAGAAFSGRGRWFCSNHPGLTHAQTPTLSRIDRGGLSDSVDHDRFSTSVLCHAHLHPITLPYLLWRLEVIWLLVVP